MAERESPALVKFVRRALRNAPGLTFEQLAERWNAQPGRAVEGNVESLRAVYDREVQVWRNPVARPRDPNHTRNVLLALALWMAAHLLLLAAIGLPAYQTCQRGPPNSTEFLGGCGMALGLTALAVGWLQPVYGVVIALIALRLNTAIAQGIFIAIGITALLFTALCFGGAVSA